MKITGQLLSDDDLVDHRNRIKGLFDIGTLDASWAQVADFTDVASFAAVSTEGIRRLAEGNPWPKVSLRVIVAPQNESFGLARMYQLLGSEAADTVHVVRRTDEALGLFASRGADPV